MGACSRHVLRGRAYFRFSENLQMLILLGEMVLPEGIGPSTSPLPKKGAAMVYRVASLRFPLLYHRCLCLERAEHVTDQADLLVIIGIDLKRQSGRCEASAP